MLCNYWNVNIYKNNNIQLDKKIIPLCNFILSYNFILKIAISNWTKFYNPLNGLLYVVFDDVKGEKRKRPFTSSGTTYIICIGDYFVL